MVSVVMNLLIMVVWQESALLRLAERQAGREEELGQAHQRARQAEARADDLDQDVALLHQQVAALKEVCPRLPLPLTPLRSSACSGTSKAHFVRGSHGILITFRFNCTHAVIQA